MISTLGYKNQLSDLDAIRRQLGQEKNVLLGHSFDALLATLYTQKYQDNVAALILVAPAAMLKSDTDFDLFIRLLYFFHFKTRIRKIISDSTINNPLSPPLKGDQGGYTFLQ